MKKLQPSGVPPPQPSFFVEVRILLPSPKLGAFPQGGKLTVSGALIPINRPFISHVKPL